MNELKRKWSNANADEREVIVIAYWVAKGKKTLKTPGSLTDGFLNLITAKQSMVERIFTDCNATRDNLTIENPTQAVEENNDAFSMLGFEPYETTMVTLVSENTQLFKQAVRTFNNI